MHTLQQKQKCKKKRANRQNKQKQQQTSISAPSSTDIQQLCKVKLSNSDCLHSSSLRGNEGLAFQGLWESHAEICSCDRRNKMRARILIRLHHASRCLRHAFAKKRALQLCSPFLQSITRPSITSWQSRCLRGVQSYHQKSNKTSILPCVQDCNFNLFKNMHTCLLNAKA